MTADLDALISRVEEGAGDYWTRPIAERLRERAAAARAEGTGTAISDATHFEQAADEIDRLTADKARLDFLDACNAALNGRYGTNYGWSLVLTHNVTRLMLGRSMEVDLHDSEGGNTKLASCRNAIDREKSRIEVERRARALKETRHDG